MRIVRRMLVFAAALACLGYAVVCAFLYFNQERLIFHPEVLPATERFKFTGSFDDFMVDVDGARLNLLHFKVPHPKGVILYFHGNAGSLRTWGANGEALTAYGYDIVMPDYRGYGKSTGQITSERALLDDAMTVYDFVAGQTDEGQIVVWGRSLGSGLATWVASQRSPRLLVLESAYFNFRETAKRAYPFVPDALIKYPLPSNEWIGDVKCPIILIHGRFDDIVPFESSVRLGREIHTQHELIPIEGVGHNDLTQGIGYNAVIARILQ